MKFITKTIDQLRNDANFLMESSKTAVTLANEYDAQAQRLIATRRAFRVLAKEEEREAQKLRELANKLEREYK